MNRPSPTLKQIADAMGVHPSTVSRALDPKKRHLVSEDVVQRVTDEARALGYQPNGPAASLRTGRSGLIGVLLPDIANPVFAPILGGIAEVLSEQGFAPVVADAGERSSDQMLFVDNLLRQRVDGLILATVFRDDAMVAHCIERGLPVVLVNRSDMLDRVSSVVSDDFTGMRLAVDHLADLGHRRIAHVAGPLATSTGLLRRDGFMRAMESRGLTGEIREAERYSRDAGARAASQLLADPAITAVVAANDLIALGVIDALRQSGRDCPHDVSVVGHNDMPLIDVVSPPLTTVRIEHREMGRGAARLLVRKIEESATPVEHVMLAPELVVRKSTTPPRA